MNINVVYKASIRNFVRAKPTGNPGLNRALYRIAGEVIRAGWLVLAQKQLGFVEPEARKPAKSFPIVRHHTATLALMCGCGS